MLSLLLLLAQDLPPELVDGLRSPEIQVREKAALGLRALGTAALPGLDRLASDADPEVAAKASGAARLIRLEGVLTPKLRAAFPGLAARLAQGADRDWTEVLLQADEDIMTRTGDGATFTPRYPGLARRDLEPLASRALKGAEKGEQRKKVLRAILGKRLRVPAADLAPLLPELGDEGMRALALDPGVEARDLLRRGLQDPRAEVVDAAAAALALRGDRSTIPRLEAAIGRADCDGNCLRTADIAIGLGALDSRESVGRILPWVRSEDWHVRNHAIQALGDLGAEAAAGELVRLTEDPEVNVASSAWRALMQVGGPLAIEANRKRLDGEERLNAAGDAGSLGDREAIPLLRRLLSDPEPGMRSNAAYSLGELGDLGAVEMLSGLLTDVDEDVREAAFQVLAEFGRSEVAPRGLALLESKDYWDRIRGADTLCRLGERQGVRRLLDDSDCLWSLNALRRRDAWTALRGKRMPGSRLRGSASSVLAALAAAAGLAIEADPAARTELDAFVVRRGWLPLQASVEQLFESLEGMLPGRIHFVLEPDRIRVLSCEEGHRFWEAWFAGK